MLRICDRCGWAHLPVSREQAERQAREFGEYIVAQPPEVQARFGFGPESKTKREWDFAEHVARLERCFHCGNPHTNFHDQTDVDQVPRGATVQGIIRE